MAVTILRQMREMPYTEIDDLYKNLYKNFMINELGKRYQEKKESSYNYVYSVSISIYSSLSPSLFLYCLSLLSVLVIGFMQI